MPYDQEYTVANVEFKHNIMYSFWLRARNNLYSSEYTQVVQVNLPYAPKDVREVSRTTSSVMIEWDEHLRTGPKSKPSKCIGFKMN